MGGRTYEAIVIGSGFGGAVSACRLAKRWPGEVLVLERGRRYPRGSFPRSPDGMARNFWSVRAGENGPALPENRGIFDVRGMGRMDVIVASGVGGGSLVYANVFLEPPDAVWDDPRWPSTCTAPALAPYYDVARSVLGARTVPIDDGDRRVNRSHVSDDKGEIRARYDKIHMFDVTLPTGENWTESAAYAGGDAIVLVDTPLGRLGLSICYDLRFPELYRALVDGGAELIAIPAAFTAPTGEAHWHPLLRTRAIETACHVVAAAQAGTHADGRATFGHSLAVDPWGTVLMDVSLQRDDGAAGYDIGFVAIDAQARNRARAAIPLARSRSVRNIEL